VTFHFGLTFRAWLVFWTNLALSSGTTGDPADRLYAVLGHVDWTEDGEWNINPTTGALTIVTAPTITAAFTPTSPPSRAADTSIEVRVPRALALLARDAKT
jgi:hypothetical protein